MPTPAPHARMVKVRDTATGHVFEAWPVDAREMVRTEHYTYADPDALVGAPDAAPEPAPVLPTPAEILRAKSHRELQALAKQAGVRANQTADELVSALLPHVAAGTVSLEVVAPLTIPHASLPQAEG